MKELNLNLFSFFAVERRRRDKINNWIVTLSKIIPDCSVDSRTGAVSAGFLFLSVKRLEACGSKYGNADEMATMGMKSLRLERKAELMSSLCSSE